METIECINSKNEVFFAHFFGVGRNNNILEFKCGVCSYGNIIFDSQSKMFLNVTNNKCNSCKCNIVLA